MWWVWLSPMNWYEEVTPMKFETATIASAMERLKRRKRLVVRSSLKHRKERMMAPAPRTERRQVIPTATLIAVRKPSVCEGKNTTGENGTVSLVVFIVVIHSRTTLTGKGGKIGASLSEPHVHLLERL